MNSIWTKTSTAIQFDSLKHDTKTDVLIVGGGLSGLLCAYMLDKAGINYVLCEADRICSGITKNTTAKITLQHGLIYDKLISRYGIEKAKMYLDANKSALEKYRTLCKEIDCEFCEQDAYVYSSDKERLEKEVLAYERLGYEAELVSQMPIPVKAEGAVKIKGQAQFHPLKFAYAISEHLNILENTKVYEFTPSGAVTSGGVIKADKTIITTHFPMLNKHGSYFLKLYQHRSYVLALENALNINGMYVDDDDKGMSFRTYNNLLLLGGGGHRTGKNGGNWRELEDFAAKCFPKSKPVYRWATQDCMSLDGVPYIGQYSASTPNLYVATGFNKWGMTSAMAAAEILTDMVQGKENAFSPVFSPSRSVLHIQTALNAAESLMGLLTPTAPRCPHLGCALKYNKAEHTWDCPCHGSRFTENGELIDNPATDDRKRRIQ